ncbi:aldo/keto reductase [Ornithinibacillus halotolerans]|uniref:Glyoxal reductase n=1 Tax=Ornithinibacillus halotolerans TaxID=1274357 RepID=A0A916S2Z1_9BACI|nr:aldo/keto reductase [Ornithinibacillus halotolerans]GGA79037.1 glyoxal reductase [Ornithinibacillus halotolerans]
MISSLDGKVVLNNGVEMPGFGLGVYKVDDGISVFQTVRTAIEYGYRSIDTASFYQNEQGVGQAVRKSGIPREELFITSKVWNTQQGYEETLQAFEESLEKLGLDYLDLYLVHWPVRGKFVDTYRALEKLYQDGRVRAIGVSNFHIHHLEELLASCTIKPVVNQVEYHPHLTQVELKAFCEKNNIQLEAWSPLKRGRLLDEPTLVEIGKKYGKSPAQVILRWDIQNHVITIPKSTNVQRIKENANIFDFELTEEEMNRIDDLNINDRSGSNPDDF